VFPEKMLFFPDCCTVIQGAPRLVACAPRLVTCTPRHVACTPRIVAGAPRHIGGAPRCSKVHSTLSPAPQRVLIPPTIAPRVLLYESSEIPVTLKASWNEHLGSDTLLKLTHLSLHSTSPKALLEASSDQNALY
jgi:hypothetical protein